jgi:hypothetical protein
MWAVYIQSIAENGVLHFLPFCAIPAQSGMPGEQIMMTAAHERYRALLLRQFSQPGSWDAAKAETLVLAVRDRLMSLAASNKSFDLGGELDALNDEYDQLLENPEAYLAGGRDAASPKPASHFAAPQRDTDATQPTVAPVTGAAGQMPRDDIEPAGISAPASDRSAPEHAVVSAPPSRLGRAAKLAIAATFMVAAAALLAAADVATCGLISKRCFDSGWMKADNSKNTTLRLPHGMGGTPARLQVWFSPNATGVPAYPTEFRWPSTDSGNPINISADDTDIRIAISANIYLRGIWDADTDRWTHYRSGYLRTVAQR